VLVVDDDPNVHRLIAAHLAGARYRLLDAMGGQQGVDLAIKTPPDLIILDLMMPGMSGFDVVQTLRARPSTAKIPVLVLTALSLTAPERERLNGDVVAVMEKSHFKAADFVAEVQRALARGGIKEK
jgi:CheY-like chemotaxis protein